MKNMRKLASLLLAIVMVLAMNVTAFAADPTTYTITITYSESGHTYEAYQIFTGDLDSTGEILSNIQWGKGVKSVDLLAALKDDTTTTVTVTDLDDNTTTKAVTVGSLFGSCQTAADVAKVLSDNNGSNELAERFAQLASENLTTAKAETSTGTASPYTISGLTAGYYLVKDQDDSVTAAGDSYTDIILKVVTNVTVGAKADTTELDKIISDTDSDASSGGNKNDTTANYSVGDDVPFTLTATLPSNYDDYKTYKLTFHDTLSSGLTFNDDVTVTVYTAYTGLSTFDPSTTYYKADSTTGALTVVDTTAETVPTSTETYYIKTVVNTGYVVATSTDVTLSDTCTFEVQIADTNSLYDANSAVITVTDSSRIVVTYTAKLNDGAKTTLTQTNTAKVEYSNNPNDDGSGTGKTPDDVTTVFTFNLTANKVDEDGVALSGAGFTLYKAEEVSITEFASGTTYYILSNGLMKGVDAAATFDSQETYYVYNAVGREVTGVTSFKFSGLGTGYYKLVETTTPDGYNTMDDLYFSIEAVTEEDAGGNASVESLTIKDEQGNVISGTDQSFTVSASAQTIKTNITNKKGSTLPTTGGIGTTVFYVVGGVMVLGAAVLLITRRRMSRSK